MPTYKLGGINVQFPYKAYDCQLVYMERVIHALQQGCNALLESPTGTGKTLCLLCATLAWRESVTPAVAASMGMLNLTTQDDSSSPELNKPKLPTILYASRTHSQLQQVIRELKATSYRPKMVVLGSREQMCIHRDVQLMRGRGQTQACRALCKERSCTHQNRVADYMKSHPDLGLDPIDIEDLVKIGRTQGPCPYYLSRELHSSADIIFLPYNYLIEKENRRSLSGISWEKTVLIFDEAHNLEGLCADAASFDLPSTHLTACITEAKQCVDLAISHRGQDNGADASIDPDNFAVLKALLLELEKRINEVSIESNEVGFTRPGSYIYEFLSSMKINWDTATMLIDTIDQATTLLEDGSLSLVEAGTGSIRGPGRPSGTTYRLHSLRDALRLIFRGSETAHANCYKVHIHESRNREPDKLGRKGAGAKVVRTLSWWCFNPGIAMEEFAKMGVRSVILTSGTLAPLDSFALELNLPFNVRLENPHVIDASQIWVGVVQAGPSGRGLNSSYKTRDSPEYKQDLGNTIVNFARIVPDGLLVFFPSYHLLNSCVEFWQTVPRGAAVNSSTIWERISKFKQPVIEPRESALFNQANESYIAKLSDTSSSGAVFFAVCRGKVSEGLDFADRAGRAVVVTGIPYAMKTDPKVRLKREYLDETVRANSTSRRGITGEEWYVQQASRAVNQAIGRVIRHRNDYGAIILCDERFAQGNSQGQMSLWLRPHIKCYSKFGDAAFSLTRFFKDKAASVPMKSLKDVPPSGTTLPAVEHTADVVSISSGVEPLPREQTIHQIELSGEYTWTKTSVAMGSISGGGRLGQAASSAASGSLSDILASNRVRSNQTLSSLPIVSANCAVGSTTGFVRESYKESEIKAEEPHKRLSAASAKVTTSLTINTKKRLTEEPLEKPWSLSKHLKSEDKVSAPEEVKTDLKCDDTVSNANHVVKDQANPPAEKLGSSSVSPVTPAQLPSDEKIQQVVQPSSDARKNEKAVVSKPAADGKSKNAAAFLEEVKAHLSVGEYSRFLDCMRGLKNQLMSMATLLEAVANLFSAPERLFLLRRFGDFVPAKHRQLYEEVFSAKRAELGYQSVDLDGEGSARASEAGSLKACLNSKSRRAPTKKNLNQ
ncbi:hypothetical protein R1sor_023400 [Riccia sorocarpa]|uniref:Regulator of telomere elongation helicase 1 homolog n=1 Tax=Riccia sorocarpa TaxID=122646 RepID=A0ABD3GPS8_9MARC